MSVGKHKQEGGVEIDPPTPEELNPPSNTEEIFSKQKGLMDYINWKDIQRKTGITKDTAYTFILKEILDNSVDYIETYHNKLAKHSVQVNIDKPYGCNYVELVGINSNDGTAAFNEDKIRSILDPKSKYSSKRNQGKINRGALGDALKEVFGIPYALVRDHDQEGDKETSNLKLEEEWNEPLIIRNNSTVEEYQVRLIVDRIKQDYGLDVTKTMAFARRHTHDPNTTEIEIHLPLFDDGYDDDDGTNTRSKLVHYAQSYFLFATHIDFTLDYLKPIELEQVQPIERNWKSQTSAYYFTLPQFRDFILELENDDQQIYDVLYKIFREASSIPKNSLTQKKVGQIKNSTEYIGRLYNLLRDSMDSPSSFPLPFNVNNKKIRAEALKNRAQRVYGEISDVKYKSDFGVVKPNNDKVQVPFFFEIAVMHREREGAANLVIEQAINCSAVPGNRILFSGKEFWFSSDAGKYENPATSIYDIFQHYGYSYDDKKARKKHSLILMNLISPRIDYQNYGKSDIDYLPFIKKVAELTVKACQGGGSRALDGKPTLISILREILEERMYKWDSWDAETRQSHWWTMSDVFYAARKRLVEEEGYNQDEIDRDYLTGEIKDICENYLHRKREDMGIIAADRAQLYFNGQWMDVGYNEIRELALYGTDLIIIEKEGMAEQLKTFADEDGIALLFTRGFLTEYAEVLSEKSENEGCNISILTDFDASGLVLARAVPDAYRIGIDFDTLEELGIELEDVQEKYDPKTHLNPLKAGGKHEGVYSDDTIDFISDKRVEINSVVVELDDNRKFWNWMLGKLRFYFPERDYGRSVTTNKKVIPQCLAELNELAEEENAIILKPHVDRLDDNLSSIRDGFLSHKTNITIPEYQNTIDQHKVHIVEQNSEMQEYWERIEALVKEFRLRKEERERRKS